MSHEVQETVEVSVEEAVVEQAKEGKKGRWELLVALSSSILAVISVTAALVAGFSSDEATISLASETDSAVAAEAASSNLTLLRVKLELLSAMGKPITDSHNAELKRMEEHARTMRERAEAFAEEGDKAFKAHDTLAVAVTLFQVTMLLNGISVMVARVSLWRFGLVFSVIGLYFFVRGLGTYLH
jgi:hypothetical protein